MGKKIGLRALLLFGMLLTLSRIDSLGWMEALVSTLAGLLFYWLLMAAIVAFMLLGVFRPLMAYLSQQDSQFAKFMTLNYRRRKR